MEITEESRGSSNKKLHLSTSCHSKDEKPGCRPAVNPHSSSSSSSASNALGTSVRHSTSTREAQFVRTIPLSKLRSPDETGYVFHCFLIASTSFWSYSIPKCFAASLSRPDSLLDMEPSTVATTTAALKNLMTASCGT